MVLFCANPLDESITINSASVLLSSACTGFWWGNLRERKYWGDPGADGRIILRWIFRKWDVGV